MPGYRAAKRISSINVPLRLLIFSIVLAFAWSGCSRPDAPDLRRLYQSGMEPAHTPPVIILPGVLGSTLRDRTNGEQVWPGSLYNVVFKVHTLALDIDPQTLEPRPDSIEADDLFRGVLGSDVYGAILQTLERSGGYVRGRPGQHADPGVRRYYVLPYDWRQDNVVTARKLDALIEQIRLDYADPQLKVDLVAHSMGGLIARYYIQYGKTDVLTGNEFPANFAGAAKLRTVILLGTPNLGSVSALRSFLKGHHVGLQSIPCETLATMPSLYELLPHPVSNWIIDAQGRPLDKDLYFAGTWLAYRWCVYDPVVLARIRARYSNAAAADAYIKTLQSYFVKRLERARRFVWSLTYNETQQAPVKLVVFGADCRMTPARVVVEDSPEEGQDAQVRLYPEDIRRPVAGVDYARLMLEPGDGAVTKPSLLARAALDPTAKATDDVFFPLAYSFFLCEDHQHLTGNINFQDNLLNVLLSPEHPWDMGASAAESR